MSFSVRVRQPSAFQYMGLIEIVDEDINRRNERMGNKDGGVVVYALRKYGNINAFPIVQASMAAWVMRRIFLVYI
ncbi:MAG: hypothetical protein ACMUIS_07825 [bacterium]